MMLAGGCSIENVICPGPWQTVVDRAVSLNSPMDILKYWVQLELLHCTSNLCWLLIYLFIPLFIFEAVVPFETSQFKSFIH